MSYNPFDQQPKELISDSLKDVMADDDALKTAEEIFILVSFLLENDEIFTGNIVGVEFGENPKLDVKVLTRNCFNFVGGHFLNNKRISALIFSLGDDMIQIPGPFQISNLKIVEMDYENKACVVAIDLFKDQP